MALLFQFGWYLMIASGRPGGQPANLQGVWNERGWVLHHNFDLWRGTVPINASNHGIRQTIGAWFAQHLWEHRLFGGDRRVLRETAYPLMRGAALFFVDALVDDPPTGRRTTRSRADRAQSDR